jgi:orotidine-5'-phosphate decarboxylase
VGSAVEELELDLAGAHGPLLAPGVGAQGGTPDDLRRVFGDALPSVLPSSSREVLSAGPEVVRLGDQAQRTSQRLADLLR